MGTRWQRHFPENPGLSERQDPSGLSRNNPSSCPTSQSHLLQNSRWESSAVGKFGMKPDCDQRSSGYWEHLGAGSCFEPRWDGKIPLGGLGDSTFQDLESCIGSWGCTDHVFLSMGIFWRLSIKALLGRPWISSGGIPTGNVGGGTRG